MKKKDFKPTLKMINAAETVFLAKAMVETIKPIVEGYQKEILQRYQFTNKKDFELAAKSSSDRWEGLEVEVILDPKHTYRMSDEDFLIYNNECKAARDKARLHVDSDDFCPLLVAEDLLIQAERALVDAMEPITKISFQQVMCSSNALENLKKLIDLTLGLMSKFVSKERMLAV